MQDGFDVFQKQRLDIALFEVVGTIENKDISLDVHRFQLIEPGGNGGFREIFFQLLQYVVPYVGNGVQQDAPLSFVNWDSVENPAAFQKAG